jgi:hypothetical protein
MKKRIGQAGYARMARALTDSALTIQDLPARAKVGKTAARRFVLVLHALRHVHIESWTVEPKRAAKPLWRMGPGDDAEPPVMRPDGRPTGGVRNHSTQERPTELLCWARLLLMLDGGGTVAELSRWAGLHSTTTRRAIAALRGERMVYVSGWRAGRAGCGSVAEYAWGEEADTARPRMDRPTVNARYIARRRMRHMMHALH